MDKLNIAITGVGGGVGQSIIKSLQNTEYHLFALDGELLAAGLYSTPNSFIIPYANDVNFIPKLLKICMDNKISILFPGLDAELMPLANNIEKFEAIGTKVIVSRPEVIKISDNKQETYNQLIKSGVNVPFTCLATEFNTNSTNYPIILKQKEGGARSKNIYVIKTISEWTTTISNLDLNDFIVMDYIEGDEYTCGTINLDNNCKGVIVMRRILRDGDTNKCFVEKNETIEKEVRKVVDALKPFGACNVQLRLKDGVPYVFEINARCSGTTAARTLSGFNEPKLIADYLLKNIEPKFNIKEQTILRYWKEIVVENEIINELELNNHISFKTTSDKL
ncbi:MAG: ATP-grasp domain-containing protein [Flavobacteriales bacterium]|nr:ATP-grasp domain-containing protein [Flavobacteriales bacterium]